MLSESRTESAADLSYKGLEASEQKAIREESSRDHTKSGDQMRVTDGFKAGKMAELNKFSSSHNDNINHAATDLLFLGSLLSTTSRFQKLAEKRSFMLPFLRDHHL